MRAGRGSGIRRLRGLKNISWLTSRQLNRLVDALSLNRVEKRDIIFDEKHSPEFAYLLLSGVARITCRNRKGDRILVIMVAPGMIPGFPRRFPGSGITSAASQLPTARSELLVWKRSLKSLWE
jgi:CRP-like cAMP-binding protein